jgi:hypothetical protein
MFRKPARRQTRIIRAAAAEPVLGNVAARRARHPVSIVNRGRRIRSSPASCVLGSFRPIAGVLACILTGFAHALAGQPPDPRGRAGEGHGAAGVARPYLNLRVVTVGACRRYSESHNSLLPMEAEVVFGLGLRQRLTVAPKGAATPCANREPPVASRPLEGRWSRNEPTRAT